MVPHSFDTTLFIVKFKHDFVSLLFISNGKESEEEMQRKEI